MSALHAAIAFAAEIAAQKEAAVSAIAAEKAKLTEREKAAQNESRQARGLLVRLRGALEAASRIPEAAPILAEDMQPIAELKPSAPDTLAQLGLRAGTDAEPPLVEVGPAIAFTPAFDYPDSHPVEPPRRTEAAPPAVTPAAEAARPARPNAAKVRALADEILGMFIQSRHNDTSSLQLEAVYEKTGKSHGAVDRALLDLVERKLIRKCKAAERGHVTVILKVGEVAA